MKWGGHIWRLRVCLQIDFAVLRKAFEAAAKDPELLAQAAKQDIAISLMTGERVSALVERIYKTPPEVVALTKSIVDPQ